MPDAKLISFALLAVFLAGCTTDSQRRDKPPPDWGVVPPPKPAPTPRVAKPAPAPKPAPVRAAVRPAPEPTWLPLDAWSREHGATPQRLSALPSPTYSVSTTNGVLVIQTGSRSAFWDGVEFQLGFVPILMGGRVHLHRLDILKNLEPLMRRFDLTGRTNLVIVIDPGHGGGNTGTHSVLDGRCEKEFTLDWALRLAALLEQQGRPVLLTRTNDTEMTLLDRVNFAGRNKADLFISLHFNSGAPNEEPAGLETYCLTPTGMPSNLVREFDDDPALIFPNNACDEQNLQLALELHRALLAVNGHLDRGISRARFPGVLRGHRCPAVLVEGGYLSNPAEARRIEDPAYRQKLAEALAGVLAPGTAIVAQPELPADDSDGNEL